MKKNALSKDILKIQNTLTVKEKEQAEKIAIFNSKIEKARQELQQASTDLETADNPADYNAALEKIRIAKGTIEFYNRELQRIGTIITPAEHKAIVKDCTAAYWSAIHEQAEIVKEKFADLMAYMEQCAADAEQYKDIIRDADRLANIKSNTSLHYMRDMTSIDGKNMAYTNFMTFCASYQQSKAILSKVNMPYSI